MNSFLVVAITLCLLLSSFPIAAQVMGPYRMPVEAQGKIGTVGLYRRPQRKPLSTRWGHVEQMPMFEGGVEGVLCFLYRNNQFASLTSAYPAGRVFVAFVVDTPAEYATCGC